MENSSESESANARSENTSPVDQQQNAILENPKLNVQKLIDDEQCQLEFEFGNPISKANNSAGPKSLENGTYSFDLMSLWSNPSYSLPTLTPASALSNLLQKYRKPTPDYITSQDDNGGKGRLLFTTTVSVKELEGIQGTAQGYNKRSCKHAAAAQFLTNLREEYPTLDIPNYAMPVSALDNTSNFGIKEIRNLPGKHTFEPQEAEESKVDMLERISKGMQGVEPKYFNPRRIETSGKQHELICTLGTEVTRGNGQSEAEAKEDAATKMVRLLQDQAPSTTVHHTPVSKDIAKAMTNLPAEIQINTSKRAQECWATEVTVKTFGTELTQPESLKIALEKAIKALKELAVHQTRSGSDGSSDN